MNTANKRSRKAWWIGGMTLVAASVVALSAHAFGGGHGGGHGGGMGWGDGPRSGMHMGGRGLDRMLDGANATPEQRTKIKQIMVAAQEDMRAQRLAHQSQRDDFVKLLSQPKIDASAVEKLRQQQLAQHDAASKRMTTALLESANVLSAEQRAKVAEQMKQRMAMRDAHRMQGGKGGMGPADGMPGRAGSAPQ